MSANREELKAEFINLRTAELPKNKYGRDRYYDNLLDLDVLAEMKTDDELVSAIKRMKGGDK